MNNCSIKIGRSAPDFYCGNTLLCGQQSLSLAKPLIMGGLNVTPDSFSDGGRFVANNALADEAAVASAIEMHGNGANIIDIGGESTRPGAEPVSVQQELDRVIPVIEQLCAQHNFVVSVDTSSPEVMLAAAAAGAGLINDVRALSKDGAMAAAKKTGLPVCLMHMQGMPSSMQDKPSYSDVVDEVAGYLSQRLQACIDAGIKRSALLVDPGFGFGKTLEHNLMLFNSLPKLRALGYPLLVGVSRKSMLGQITGRDVDQRVVSSAVMAALAVHNGANIVRVHDVAETKDALAVVNALETTKHDT